MPKYSYSAVSDAGEARKGVIEADHANDARIALVDEGLYGIEVAQKQSVWKTEITKKKVPRAELMNFSRQLGAFVRAGIPIIDAIETLRAETRNEQFRAVIADVSESLRSGQPLGEAVAEHPEAFPSFYVTILRSAEMTGHVDEVLEQLADYIERDESARRKIKQALTYPLVVIGFAVVAVVVLVVLALPRFQTFFDSLDAKLPLPTRILISITNFLTSYWWLLLLGFGVVLLAAFLYFRTDRGRHTKDRLLINAPVIGELVRFTIVERFCRLLGSMIAAGVQVPDAMEVAAGGTNNLIYREALEEAREKMMRGEGMAEPITATELFPGGVCQMVRVGEETGTLDDQLEVAANFYGKEVAYKLDKLTALFEPALLLGVGLVVGFVAIALVSAMYGIFSQVKVKVKGMGVPHHDRTGEAGVTLIEALVALFIIATAVLALLGGLGSSIVASDMHRKTVTADAVVRSWAEKIQAAPWVSCATAGAPYGPPPVPNATFTGTVTTVQYGTASGVGFGPCTPNTTTDTVQTLTLVVKASDGRGIAAVQTVKRKP